MGAPALSQQPAGYTTPFGLARNFGRAVSRARGTGPVPFPMPAEDPAARPKLEKSRSMKELSTELPEGWEACRNYANNMVGLVCTSVLFYYKVFLLPDVAWIQMNLYCF